MAEGALRTWLSLIRTHIESTGWIFAQLYRLTWHHTCEIQPPCALVWSWYFSNISSIRWPGRFFRLIVNPPEPRCMPAIVPLDRETQKGTLLVVSAGMLKGFELHQLSDHNCFHLLVRDQQVQHGSTIPFLQISFKKRLLSELPLRLFKQRFGLHSTQPGRRSSLREVLRGWFILEGSGSKFSCFQISRHQRQICLILLAGTTLGGLGPRERSPKSMWKICRKQRNVWSRRAHEVWRWLGLFCLFSEGIRQIVCPIQLSLCNKYTSHLKSDQVTIVLESLRSRVLTFCPCLCHAYPLYPLYSCPQGGEAGN